MVEYTLLFRRPFEITEGWSRIQCNIVAGETDQDSIAVMQRSAVAIQREIADELAINTTGIVVSGECMHNST